MLRRGSPAASNQWELEGVLEDVTSKLTLQQESGPVGGHPKDRFPPGKSAQDLQALLLL